VIDSRLSQGGEVTRRRRECENCGRRYTTYERVEQTLPLILKNDGRRQPYDRDKHPELYGNIDGRYDGGKVLVGLIDGHTEFRTAAELRDMRMWSNDAARRDDPEWSPANPR